jgi:hypothetical protein
MNIFLAFLSFLSTPFLLGHPQESVFVLPSVWSKDFTISIYDGGGMQDVALNIKFTYDSCHSVIRTGTIKKNKSFALTRAYREQILKKMRELKVGQIRSKRSEGVTMDKGTTEICFTIKKEYCLEDTGSTQILDEDRENFFGAYAFLENFAKEKK